MFSLEDLLGQQQGTDAVQQISHNCRSGPVRGQFGDPARTTNADQWAGVKCLDTAGCRKPS